MSWADRILFSSWGIKTWVTWLDPVSLMGPSDEYDSCETSDDVLLGTGWSLPQDVGELNLCLCGKAACDWLGEFPELPPVDTLLGLFSVGGTKRGLLAAPCWLGAADLRILM